MLDPERGERSCTPEYRPPLRCETGKRLILLLLLVHQFSLRAHFQVSININKYIIESEARTVRRLTKSDIEKVS